MHADPLSEGLTGPKRGPTLVHLFGISANYLAQRSKTGIPFDDLN